MDDELEQVLGFLEALDEDFDEVDEAMTYLWEADEGDEEYLDDDDYSYEEEPVEKYDARNNEELADLQ